MITIGLERIGDHSRHVRRQKIKAGARLTTREIQGLPTPWVARITGISASGAPLREFLKPLRDYTHANASGNRGVMDYYHLAPGVIYEVQAVKSIGRKTRYFAVVDGRTLRTVSAQEVLAWRF